MVKNKILFSITIWGTKRLNFMSPIRSEDLDSFRILVKTCDHVTITFKNNRNFSPLVEASDVLTIFITQGKAIFFFIEKEKLAITRV